MRTFSNFLIQLPVFGALLLLVACASDSTKRTDPLDVLRAGTISPQEQAKVDSLMLQAEDQLRSNEDYPAIHTYEEVWTSYPDSPDAPEALYRAANIRIQHHQFSDAFNYFNKILSNYPNYPRFNDVVRDQFDMASSMMEGERPYYFGIIPGFVNYEAAIDYFEGVVKKAPFSDYAPLALMNISLIADKNGKPLDSIDALERLINSYPRSVLAPDAYLKLAQIYTHMVQGPEYDQGATKDSIRYYQDFLILFPNNPKVPQAEAGLADMKNRLAQSKLFMGNLYRNRLKDDTAALVFYNEAITAAPKSQAAEDARIKIADIRNHVPAPGTPIDFLFTERQLSLKEYEDESYVDARATDIFEPLQDEGLLDTPSEIIQSATPLEEALREQDSSGEKTNSPEPSLEDTLEELDSKRS